MFCVYACLYMRDLFRAVIALRALPLILHIFRHLTFDHVIQLLGESAIQSFNENFYFKYWTLRVLQLGMRIPNVMFAILV